MMKKAVLYIVTAFMVFVTIYTLGIRIDIFTTAFDMIQEKFGFIYFYGFLVVGAGCISLLMLLVARKKLKGFDIILLAALMVSLVISAFMNTDLGLKDNLSGVVTIAVTVVSFFLIGKCFTKEELHFCLTRVILWASVLWNYGCVVSLGMYLECYSGYYKFGGFIRRSRMGLMDGRLFGCFSDPNYAAMIAVLIIGGLVYIFRKHSRECKPENGEKRPLWLSVERIYIVCSIILYLFYIVLAQSRSAEVAIIATGLILIILFTYRRRNHQDDTECDDGCITKAIHKLSPTDAGVFRAYGVRMILMLGVMVIVYFGIMFGLQTVGSIVIPDRDVEAELIRDDVTIENFSNSRIDIWIDYLMLVKDRPVFGLSTRGALPYAKRVDPTGYLAETGYNQHSMFVQMIVHGGAIGFILMIMFLLRSFFRIRKRLTLKEPINKLMILSLFLVLIHGVFCVFNVGIFITPCFEAMLAWIGLGYLEQCCENTIKVNE